MLNPKEYMVVDLEQRGTPQMFMTSKIQNIYERGDSYLVTFIKAVRPYSYRKGRMLYLSHPEKVDFSKKQLYYNHKHLTDIVEAYCFTEGKHSFWYVVDTHGRELNMDGRSMYLTRAPLNLENPTVWGYLRRVATEVGLHATDGTNLLEKQLANVDPYRDQVPLAHYLNPTRHVKSRLLPATVFYPFGCNASQKKAVEAALTHQISIIQGPPGTGKTQTILNILANLVIAGKTVLIVSNNNSAVKNVAEKLSDPEVGMDFLVAQLGSAENKKLFIEQQQEYPDMTSWKQQTPASLKNEVKETMQLVGDGFERQTKLAQLKLERNELLTEQRYNERETVPTRDFDAWLMSKSSVSILRQMHGYEKQVEKKAKIGFLFKVRMMLREGFVVWKFLRQTSTVVMACLRRAYYTTRLKEIEREITELEDSLKDLHLKETISHLRATSLAYWKHIISKRYSHSPRQHFDASAYRHSTETFLHEYPIVLSTTYSAKSCINKDYVFDYVIMDEASQVDVVTGAIALSCALNAVIVGDDKQLSNVIETKQVPVLKDIEAAGKVQTPYCTTENSFLQSCVSLFKTIPVTLLREHYRCHPQIIEFCNKRFYGGQLIAMTSDHHEPNVLRAIRTKAGNYARGHFNQREIDVISQEVLPALPSEESVGIITPYRMQAEAINEQLHGDMASTVHKYQGRECDSIVMSMVDNQTTEFSDNADLLNVAISRAKSHFCVVLTGNEIAPDSNLSQLVDYIRYHNYEVEESQLQSVFDLLYKPYTEERLAYERTHSSKASEELSENLVYDLLVKVVDRIDGLPQAEVLCHYPLSKLVCCTDSLSEDEKEFVENPFTHVDFLVYNALTKRPYFCVEVDGWKFHQESEAQKVRDGLKNHVLELMGLRLIRLSTVMTLNEEVLKNIITGNPAT